MGEGAGAIVERPPFVCPALVPAAAALSGSLFCAGRNITEFIVAGSVALIVLFLFRNDRTHVRVFAVTAVLFYLWTWALAPVAVQPGERTVRGVCADVRKYPVSQRVILETAGCGRIAFTVIDIVPDLNEGDEVEVKAVICPVGRYSGVPGLGMEGLSARADRISGMASVSANEITVTGADRSLLYMISSFRRDLCDEVAAMPLSNEASGLLTTSLFGVRDLDPEIRDSFRLSGLAHLLCVSGFHIGLLAGAVLFLLWPVRLVRPWFPARYLVAASVVWVYALFVGFGPSAVRAAVMITVFALVRTFQRRPWLLNTLCVAFVAVLALDPYRMFSAGFQLSFAAVAGLLLLAPKLNPVPRRRKWIYMAVNLFVVPLSALVATLPVTLVWFHHVPALSVPANAIAVNLFPVFMTSGLVSLILFHAGLPSAWACSVTDGVCRLLNGIAGGAAELSERFDVALYPGSVAAFGMIAALAGLIVFLHVPSCRKVSAAVTVLCIVVCAGCSGIPRRAGIMIDGNGRGTDIVLVSGDDARILHSGREAGPVAQRFCSAMGLTPAMIRTDGVGSAGLGGTRIVVFDSAGGNPDKGDIAVVLDRRTDIHAVLSRNPGHVVLGGRLGSEERSRWADSCRRAGIGLTDLRYQAFYREVMQ